MQYFELGNQKLREFYTSFVSCFKNSMEIFGVFSTPENIIGSMPSGAIKAERYKNRDIKNKQVGIQLSPNPYFIHLEEKKSKIYNPDSSILKILNNSNEISNSFLYVMKFVSQHLILFRFLSGWYDLVDMKMNSCLFLMISRESYMKITGQITY